MGSGGGKGGARRLLSARSFNQSLWRYGRRALDGGIVAEEGQFSAVACALCLIFPHHCTSHLCCVQCTFLIQLFIPNWLLFLLEGFETVLI